MDVYSRKIVGWQVYEQESSALAADLMTDICLREGVKRNQLTFALMFWAFLIVGIGLMVVDLSGSFYLLVQFYRVKRKS
jgi:transposase InsO family protein